MAQTLSRTRASLYYPATYLVIAGIGLIGCPDFTLRLLFSNAHYDRTTLTLSGLFVLGLAVIVIQTIRLRIDALYPTLVGVRVLFCAGYVVLYSRTGDPFFLSLLAIVGAGMLASAFSLMRDRRPT